MVEIIDEKHFGKPNWALMKKLYAIECTGQELAELLELSPARVSQLQRDGHIHRMKNGRINMREAIVEYADYIEHRGSGGRKLGT